MEQNPAGFSNGMINLVAQSIVRCKACIVIYEKKPIEQAINAYILNDNGYGMLASRQVERVMLYNTVRNSQSAASILKRATSANSISKNPFRKNSLSI